MNVEQALLREHSRANMERIARYIGDDPDHFRELMRLFLGDDRKVSQRAGWAVSISGETHPEWIIPYISRMLKNLEKPVHPAVIRNTVRLFQFIPIPKRYQARVADICFLYFSDPCAPIAIRVFSMQVLFNLSKEYPEFKNEMQVIIDNQLPHAPPAIKSRLKRIKW